MLLQSVQLYPGQSVRTEPGQALFPIIIHSSPKTGIKRGCTVELFVMCHKSSDVKSAGGCMQANCLPFYVWSLSTGDLRIHRGPHAYQGTSVL